MRGKSRHSPHLQKLRRVIKQRAMLRDELVSLVMADPGLLTGRRDPDHPDWQVTEQLARDRMLSGEIEAMLQLCRLPGVLNMLDFQFLYAKERLAGRPLPLAEYVIGSVFKDSWPEPGVFPASLRRVALAIARTEDRAKGHGGDDRRWMLQFLEWFHLESIEDLFTKILMRDFPAQTYQECCAAFMHGFPATRHQLAAYLLTDAASYLDQTAPAEPMDELERCHRWMRDILYRTPGGFCATSGELLKRRYERDPARSLVDLWRQAGLTTKETIESRGWLIQFLWDPKDFPKLQPAVGAEGRQRNETPAEKASATSPAGGPRPAESARSPVQTPRGAQGPHHSVKPGRQEDVPKRVHNPAQMRPPDPRRVLASRPDQPITPLPSKVDPSSAKPSSGWFPPPPQATVRRRVWDGPHFIDNPFPVDFEITEAEARGLSPEELKALKAEKNKSRAAALEAWLIREREKYELSRQPKLFISIDHYIEPAKVPEGKGPVPRTSVSEPGHAEKTAKPGPGRAKANPRRDDDPMPAEVVISEAEARGLMPEELKQLKAEKNEALKAEKFAWFERQHAKAAARKKPDQIISIDDYITPDGRPKK